jgi:alpha-methylacyl-CoA racemase
MGPLEGIKIIEFAGIGPGPFCCMLLSDMGAEVVRIDRVEPADLGTPTEPRFSLLNRGRHSIALDLKQPQDVAVAKALVAKADALVEGYRPGVMERLGLGPDECLKANPRLVYGRMTGWGQEGPLAHAAGHDINYIALVGALHAIGQKNGPPVPPLNLVGDFGGGALYMAFGLVCGLLEARKSGKGQVVDAAMVDGAASLITSLFGGRAAGTWIDERGRNALNGGAHYYNPYETKDGKYISVASIEVRFYRELLERLGLKDEIETKQNDRAGWDAAKEKLTALFKTKTRDEWCAILEGTDVCFAPVLNLDEAMQHPHNKARGLFVEVAGIPQPGPAPRFSRTKPRVQGPPPRPGQHTQEVLARWGIAREEREVPVARAAGAQRTRG